MLPLNLYARVRFLPNNNGTRDRGCSAHPVFPAPSAFQEGGTKRKALGRIRAAAMRTCGLSLFEI